MRAARGGGVGRTVLIAAGLLAALGPARAGPDGDGGDPVPVEFPRWLEGIRAEARRQGISAAILDAALTGVVPMPRVLELDRRQPEFVLPLGTYVARAVSPDRVRHGRARMAEERPTLAAVAERSGVPPAIVVALWGLESDYGRAPGTFPVIPALATLAHAGRRSALFRAELLDALRMLDEGHVRLERFRGSWAGATGQAQFLPSSFLRHAVDEDGDGRRDIWTSRADVLASIAAYLVAAGWQAGVPWGHPVRRPPGGLPDPEPRPVTEWRALGLRAAGGAPLPDDAVATLVRPEGDGGPAFLVSENFEVLLRWNRSTAFAVAVGTLADRLTEPGPAAVGRLAPGRPEAGARGR